MVQYNVVGIENGNVSSIVGLVWLVGVSRFQFIYLWSWSYCYCTWSVS